MEDKNKKNESDIIVEAESIIDRHVRAKEQELLDKATISAAILCSAIAVFLSYHSGFSGLGSYSNLWSGVIGFFVGGLLGERMAFAMLGAVITYFIVRGQCS